MPSVSPSISPSNKDADNEVNSPPTVKCKSSTDRSSHNLIDTEDLPKLNLFRLNGDSIDLSHDELQKICRSRGDEFSIWLSSSVEDVEQVGLYELLFNKLADEIDATPDAQEFIDEQIEFLAERADKRTEGTEEEDDWDDLDFFPACPVSRWPIQASDFKGEWRILLFDESGETINSEQVFYKPDVELTFQVGVRDLLPYKIVETWDPLPNFDDHSVDRCAWIFALDAMDGIDRVEEIRRAVSRGYFAAGYAAGLVLKISEVIIAQSLRFNEDPLIHLRTLDRSSPAACCGNQHPLQLLSIRVSNETARWPENRTELIFGEFDAILQQPSSYQNLRFLSANYELFALPSFASLVTRSVSVLDILGEPVPDRFGEPEEAPAEVWVDLLEFDRRTMEEKQVMREMIQSALRLFSRQEPHSVQELVWAIQNPHWSGNARVDRSFGELFELRGFAFVLLSVLKSRRIINTTSAPTSSDLDGKSSVPQTSATNYSTLDERYSLRKISFSSAYGIRSILEVLKSAISQHSDCFATLENFHLSVDPSVRDGYCYLLDCDDCPVHAKDNSAADLCWECNERNPDAEEKFTNALRDIVLKPILEKKGEEFSVNVDTSDDDAQVQSRVFRGSKRDQGRGDGEEQEGNGTGGDSLGDGSAEDANTACKDDETISSPHLGEDEVVEGEDKVYNLISKFLEKSCGRWVPIDREQE